MNLNCCSCRTSIPRKRRGNHKHVLLESDFQDQHKPVIFEYHKSKLDFIVNSLTNINNQILKDGVIRSSSFPWHAQDLLVDNMTSGKKTALLLVKENDIVKMSDNNQNSMLSCFYVVIVPTYTITIAPK